MRRDEGKPTGALAGVPCAHCGVRVLPGGAVRGPVAGQTLDFCCPGCLALCQAIHDAGWGAYYTRRSSLPPTVEPVEVRRFALFDDPTFPHRDTPAGREAVFHVDGLTCAACVWLVEKAVAASPGVHEARVNFATHRARVRWDPSVQRLSGIAAAVARLGYHPRDGRDAQAHPDRDLLVRLGVAGFCALNTMMLAVSRYGGFARGLEDHWRAYFDYGGWVLATPAVLWSALPFYRGAVAGLRLRAAHMDLPISLGVVVVYAWSAAAVLTGRGEPYFDSVAMLVFLLLAGRYLERRSRERATAAATRLQGLHPRTASLRTDQGVQTVPAAALTLGDRVDVAMGEAVPADGPVEAGRARLDTALLTGESEPRAVGPGDVVLAGMVVLRGSLTVCVTRGGDDTALARMAALVETARSGRARVERLADRMAPWLVIASVTIAVGAGLVWAWIDPARAPLVTASVLVVTCPCALGLATPLGLTAGLHAVARAGVLVRDSEALERLASVDTVALDKTGTLTLGAMTPSVTQVLEGDADGLLALAAAAERGSRHPLGRALVRAAMDRGIPLGGAEDFHEEPGEGVRATVDGDEVRVGRPAWLARGGVGPMAEGPCPTGPRVAVSRAGRFVGWIGFQDGPREGVRSSVDSLERMGIAVRLMSGDHEGVVTRMAAAAGIGHAEAGLLPEQKAARVTDLTRSAHRVLFVGDGVNDAAALAAADVGLAMGSGADLTVQQADAVLLSGRIGAVPDAIALARRALATIRANLRRSLVYNVVTVGLAATGHIGPLEAAVLMPLSSLAVVLASARIARPLARSSAPPPSGSRWVAAPCEGRP